MFSDRYTEVKAEEYLIQNYFGTARNTSVGSYIIAWLLPAAPENSIFLPDDWIPTALF